MIVEKALFCCGVAGIFSSDVHFMELVENTKVIGKVEISGFSMIWREGGRVACSTEEEEIICDFDPKGEILSAEFWIYEIARRRIEGGGLRNERLTDLESQVRNT